MMEKEFNFNSVGKRMPYQVPEDYFDNLDKMVDEITAEPQETNEAQTSKNSRLYVAQSNIAQASETSSPKESQTRASSSKIKRWWIGIAAAAAIAVGAVFFIRSSNGINEEAIAQSDNYYEVFDDQLDSMNDEELQAFSDFVEDDIFLNN